MTNKLVQVGITGGIGAGKSLVCRIFSFLGAPVYPADERAKWLMANDSGLKDKIIAHFGPEAFDQNKLNRQYLAKNVFNDSEKLNLLNSLVHPAVNEDYVAWIKTIEYPYCIKEAALLFETGSYKKLDFTILVFAPVKTRVQRILKRDPFRKEEEIIAIIGKQMDEDRKIELADLVLVNDGKRMILPDILEIHGSIINNNISKDMGHGQGK
jgi:dephospho-CoA kinase